MTHAWTACQCWLGPRSDDPLRCGLNSCHYHIYAMRNLPKFARIPQGQARYCLFTAIFGFLTFYLGNWVPPPYLWRCHGWVGGAPKFFPAVFKPNEGLTVLKDWPRMAGTQARVGWWHGSHATGSDLACAPHRAVGAACRC